MLKGLFAALTLIGIALLWWGIQAQRSFGSQVTETFTGSPSDKAIWLLGAGAIAALIGVFGLFRNWRNV